MTDDLVKAEHDAVAAIRQAVVRYAEHIRETTASARREMAATNRKAQETVERRRSDLRAKEQELRQAQTALAQCQRNPRSDCSGLSQQVNAATQRHAEAKHLLDRARKAAQIAAGAQSDLVRALQAAEATVSEHSSMSASALAVLEAKLAALPHLDGGHAFHGLAARAIAIAEIAAVLDVWPVVGDAAAAFNINLPAHDQSITQMTQRQTQQEVGYVVEHPPFDHESGRSDDAGSS